MFLITISNYLRFLFSLKRRKINIEWPSLTIHVFIHFNFIFDNFFPTWFICMPLIHHRIFTIQVFKNLQFWKLPKIRKCKFSIMSILYFSSKYIFFPKTFNLKSSTISLKFSRISLSQNLKIPTFCMTLKCICEG